MSFVCLFFIFFQFHFSYDPVSSIKFIIVVSKLLITFFRVKGIVHVYSTIYVYGTIYIYSYCSRETVGANPSKVSSWWKVIVAKYKIEKFN